MDTPPPPPPHPIRIKTSTIPAVSDTRGESQRSVCGLYRREVFHAIAARIAMSIKRRVGFRSGSAGGGSGLTRGVASDGAVVPMVTVRFVAVPPGVAGLGEMV